MPPAAFSACIFRTAMLPPAKPPPAKNAVTAAFSHRTPPAKNSVCGRTPGGACTVREIGAPVRSYAAVSDAQAFALSFGRHRKRAELSRTRSAQLSCIRNAQHHPAHGMQVHVRL